MQFCHLQIHTAGQKGNIKTADVSFFLLHLHDCLRQVEANHQALGYTMEQEWRC